MIQKQHCDVEDLQGLVSLKIRWINDSGPNGKRPLDKPKWRWIDQIERNLIEIELRDGETGTEARINGGRIRIAIMSLNGFWKTKEEMR